MYNQERHYLHMLQNWKLTQCSTQLTIGKKKRTLNIHLSKILNEWNPLVKLYENSLKVLEILRVFQLVPNKMPCNKRSQKPTLAEHGRVELPAPNSAVKMCGQLNPPVEMR